MGTVFSTNDIRGRITDKSLTTENAWNVGKAFAEWLPEEGDVVVTKSETADGSIVRGLVEGLLLQGRTVIDGGIGDQQAIINALSEPGLVGAALVTHDGIQNLEIITLFDATGVAITAERGLTEIDQLVEAGNFVPAAEKGTVKTSN